MPGINFWMIFMVFGAVSKWAEKALADGRITITEAAELGLVLGGLLGIPTDVTIPGQAEAAEEEPDSAYAEGAAEEAGPAPAGPADKQE